MQHEISHQVDTILVAPTSDFTGGHHELNPVCLVREVGVLVPARCRERGHIVPMGTEANAPSGGERGAERRFDDDGAATEEWKPTRNDVDFPLVVGRNAGHGKVAEAGTRGNLHGGTARLPEQLCERELESLPAPRRPAEKHARR